LSLADGREALGAEVGEMAGDQGQTHDDESIEPARERQRCQMWSGGCFGRRLVVVDVDIPTSLEQDPGKSPPCGVVRSDWAGNTDVLRTSAGPYHRLELRFEHDCVDGCEGLRGR
jgi:hypothetical protein